MSYAIFRIFGGGFFGWPAAIAGGTLWTGIIFGIERSLLLGIDKTKNWKHVARQVAVRIPLAFMIGVTVSLPLLLRISQTVLDKELHDSEQRDIASEFDQNARRLSLPDHNREVSDLEGAMSRQQDRRQGEPDSQEYLDAKNEEERADKKHERIAGVNGRQIARLQDELAQINPSLGENGPQAERARELPQRIAQYRREIAQAAADLTAAKDRVEAARRDWEQKETDKLSDIQTRLAASRTARNTARTATDNLNRNSEETLHQLLRPNLVNEYTMLKRIENNPSHPDAKTLSHFEWELALLFFVLEVTPVGIKALGRHTPIDDATIAAEAEDEERALNASNLEIARIQKANQVAYAVEDRALEIWRDGCLKALEQQSNLTVQDLQELRKETRAVAASAA